MKNKFITILTSLIFVVILSITFSGCKKSNTKSSNSTANVTSNGSAVVQKDNKLYFLGGIVDQTSETVGNSKIYCAEIDENGNISNKTTFVDRVCGFENSSINIFGNYLYFVTPSNSKDSSGAVQNNIVEFSRIKLSGGKIQKLYSLNVSDFSSIQYAYYPSGENNLYLVIYNKSENSITSVDIGTNPKTKVIATDVTNVLFADNAQKSGVSSFVYYTTAKDKKLSNQTGNVITRVLPDGSKNEKISSESKTFTLLTIKDNALIYTDSSKIFACTSSSINTKNDLVLSYSSTSTYSQIVYFSDKLVVTNSVDDKTEISILSWNNNTVESTKICSVSEEVEFIWADENILIYTQSDIIYAVTLSENSIPTKLTETTCDDIASLLRPKVVGNYLYFMHTEDDVCSLYRVKVNSDETQEATKLS